MSQISCPLHQQKTKAEDQNISFEGWYEKGKRAWLRGAALVSLMVYVLSYLGVRTGSISAGNAWLLCILSTVVIFIGTFHFYSISVRSKFTNIQSLSTSNNKRIPVHGIFRTLFDILMKPGTLLRDIDVQRMHKLGDIYLMLIGFRPAVVVTSAALSEKISRSYDDFAKSDPRELNMPFFFQWVGNNNVVLANGDSWRRIRELTHYPLNEIHIFAPVFNQKARVLCDSIRNIVEKGEDNDKKGVEVNLSRWLKAVSLDSAGEALFGYNFNHLNEESNPGIDAMDYIINEIFDPMRIAFPIKNRLPLKSNHRLRESMKHLDGLVMDMIDHINNDKSSRSNNNVLEMLIRGQQSDVLNANELRNNIIAMVLASHETTQVSFGGVLYYLAKFPELQENLRKDALALFPDLDAALSRLDMSKENKKDDTYQKLRRFDSMENFILESLRLYSPLANQNARTTTQDTELGGYHIPKGTLVVMNIHAVHMNSSEWNSPETFNPERFENSTNKFAYLPFGAGPRICSGRNFSLMEQKIVLCHLLRYFRIELPFSDYTVPLRRGSFTGIPDASFRLRFTLI